MKCVNQPALFSSSFLFPWYLSPSVPRDPSRSPRLLQPLCHSLSPSLEGKGRWKREKIESKDWLMQWSDQYLCSFLWFGRNSLNDILAGAGFSFPFHLAATWFLILGWLHLCCMSAGGGDSRKMGGCRTRQTTHYFYLLPHGDFLAPRLGGTPPRTKPLLVSQDFKLPYTYFS